MGFSKNTNIAVIVICVVLVIAMIIIIACLARKRGGKTVIIPLKPIQENAISTTAVPFDIDLPGHVTGSRGDYTLKTSKDMRQYIRRGDPLVVNGQLFTVSTEKTPDGSYEAEFTEVELPLNQNHRSAGLENDIHEMTVQVCSLIRDGEARWVGGSGGELGFIHPETKYWISTKKQQQQPVHKQYELPSLPSNYAQTAKQKENERRDAMTQNRHTASYDRSRPVSKEMEEARRQVRAEKSIMHQEHENRKVTKKSPNREIDSQFTMLPNQNNAQVISNEGVARSEYLRQRSMNKENVPTASAHNTGGVTFDTDLYKTEVFGTPPDSEVVHHGGKTLTESLDTIPTTNESEGFTSLAGNSEETTEKVSSSVWDRMKLSAQQQTK